MPRTFSDPLLADELKLDVVPRDGALRTRLRDLYAPIADDLARAEEVMRDSLCSDSVFIEELVKRVQLYGGKRLRPALLLLAAKACGRTTADHHLLAAVVELIHVATLVHDDVLDEADKRRHVATVNAEWGTEASLLLGDFLFTHAFQLTASVSSQDACRWLGRSTNRMCAGELHQVSRRGVFLLGEEEYLSMLSGKTAELIACACGLGARYAGAPPALEETLVSYGRNLGVAFQLADDLLDLLGDESTTGKSTGSDLRKQKMTLPLIRFRQTADAADVARLQQLFDHPAPAQNAAVVRLLGTSDALEYTEQKAMEFVEAAGRDAFHLPASPARDSLAQITQFAVERGG